MTAQLIHQETQVPTTESATPAGRGRLRDACHQIHLAIQEINYVSRRVVELKVPPTVDERWQRR